MATNGILDIQETTEDFRDPDMEFGPDEMMDIIKTLQVVGVPQEQHGEFTEEFRVWKQNNNGTFDMFLEEKYQLPPGTITKIKTTQQVATGPGDVLTEEDMTVQPGSGEMLDIMQQVGAPPVGAQPSAKGGRIGLREGGNRNWYEMLQDRSWKELDEYEGETELGKRYTDEQDAIMEKFAERFPNINTDNMKLQDLIALLQAEGVVGTEGLGLAGLEKSLDMITPESLDRSVQRISRGDTRYGDVPEEIFQGGVGQVGGMQHGGRIGYQAGEQVLPMPRPEHDPRAGFFERMGAMPEQTLLQRAGPTRTSTGIMNQTAQAMDPFGGLLEEQQGNIGMEGQPLAPYEHEGAEQPPSGFDRMQTGTYDASQDHSIDMEMIIDFLKKMGMAITKENIAKAAEALGMAKKFGSEEGEEGLGLAGLTSLGAPQRAGRGGSIGKAEGGIIDAVPRQGYFLGKAVKAITGGAKKLLKTAKKVLKSDIGKMAMLYIATAGFANIGAHGWAGSEWAQPLAKKGWLRPTQIYGNIGTSLSNLTSKVPFLGKKKVVENVVSGNTGQMSDYLKEALNTVGALSERQKMAIEAYKKTLEPVAAPWYKGALPWIGGSALAGGAYTAKYPGEEQFDTAKRDAEVDDISKWLASIQPASDITYPYPDYVGAKGGRVGYANGGILDIEEIDLRDNGGFMPLGKKEKADDVPALLSKNEFVFTADAVKSAGEGDPDVGAERMQNVMKNLEAGGKISEESQGLEGAQDMFEISERLSEVV